MFHRLNDKGDNSLTEIPGWLTDLWKYNKNRLFGHVRVK
jgi:hypothetical protein